MTEKEYRSHPAISRSELWKIRESPEKFKCFKENPTEPTPALIFGQAFHKLALQPETFSDEFAVMPQVDRRTKDGKAIWAEFCGKSTGKTIITDYKTSLRQTVKQLADSGIRTVNRESGVSRRADTAARMNILDGVRRLNQEMLLYNGEQFGSDGIELSAHAISAPDHVNVQGRQFSNTEFNKMQDGENCTDINGNTYDGFDRPIGEWNCKHFAFPIVIGISQPVHTDEELSRLKQNSAEKYDAAQEMRRRETEIRKLKDRRMAFSASGNELDAKRTQRELNTALRDYSKFCKRNGLTPKFDRIEVNGYRRISTVYKALKNGIINTAGEKMGISVEIDKFTPCLVEAKAGR